MAGRKALKSINWAAIAERVPEREKLNFAAFKSKSELYLRRVEEFPAEPPKIDWTFYKSKIAIPGLVDKFQKEYENLKVAYPEDKYTVKIDEYAKKVNSSIQQFVTESNKRIEESLAEITKLQGLMKYGDMTMEDFQDAHPEVAYDRNRPTIFPHEPEFQPSEETNKKSADH